MMSSLGGEGGGGQKMTCDDMMTEGTKYPLFTEILAKPMILNISRVLSNINIERAAELKKYSSKVMTSFMNSP